MHRDIMQAKMSQYHIPNISSGIAVSDSIAECFNLFVSQFPDSYSCFAKEDEDSVLASSDGLISGAKEIILISPSIGKPL